MSTAMPPEHTPIRFVGDGHCFACSPSNTFGLRMVFSRDGAAITSSLQLAEHYEGAPGNAHGGIIATLLDEVSCAAVVFTRGRFIVTGELSVRYQRPIPTGAPILVSAEIADTAHPRYAVVHGEVRVGGELAARSQGKFFYVEPAHEGPTWRLA